MKKTFKLVDSVKKTERVADSIKHEVKKYLKRERNKKLPTKVDFWDFDCRIGLDESQTSDIEVKEIGKNIDQFVQNGEKSFYLEILVKNGFKTPSKK